MALGKIDIPETQKGFRVMTIEKVSETSPQGDSLLIKIENSNIEFELKKEYLNNNGLTDISSGTQLNVKGKNGNTDADLWGVDVIEKIELAV